MVIPAAAWGQGSAYQAYTVGSNGLPVAGATVRVCTATGSGTPCSPLASLFSNLALTVPIPNPTTADTLGDFAFTVTPGTYLIQISGTGVTTYSYLITLSAPNGCTQAPAGAITCSTGGTNQNINLIPSGSATVLSPSIGTAWYADQWASGSQTGGIQEAYTACQNASGLTNPTGCRVLFSNDETIAGNGTVTILQGKPLYIDLQGHTINLACGISICLTFSANVPGGSANISIEHGQFLYTGSSGSSVTAGIEISGTDYHAIRDVTFGPQVGTSTIANWLTLSNAEDGIIENSNFINSKTPITLGVGTNGATPAALDLLVEDHFLGNAGPIIMQSASSIQFVDCDISGFTSANAVQINPSGNQNMANLDFINNQFSSDGDGTSGTAVILINSTSGFTNSQIRFYGNTFFANTNGLNGDVYAFTGTGVANFHFQRRGNLYVGPYAALFSGWTTGQFNVSENEMCSAWSCADHGADVLINSFNFGSGSVVANGYFGDSLATTASGFLRLASGDTLNFRNNAGSADVVGLSKNSLDQILIGANGNPTLTYRAIDSLQTTLTNAKVAFSGWGVTGSLVVANNSKDQGGLITWVAGTTSANPTVTITFQDGAWANRPFCQAWFQDNSSVAVQTAFMNGTNATQMEAEWIGTPSSGDTFQLQWGCRSGG